MAIGLISWCRGVPQCAGISLGLAQRVGPCLGGWKFAVSLGVFTGFRHASVVSDVPVHGAKGAGRWLSALLFEVGARDAWYIGSQGLE